MKRKDQDAVSQLEQLVRELGETHQDAVAGGYLDQVRELNRALAEIERKLERMTKD